MEQNNVILGDFHKICRVCLKENENLQPFHEMNEQIVEILRDATQLELEENDPFPKNMCPKCLIKLKIMCIFVLQCRDSDLTLKCSVIHFDHNYLEVKKDKDADVEIYISDSDSVINIDEIDEPNNCENTAEILEIIDCDSPDINIEDLNNPTKTTTNVEDTITPNNLIETLDIDANQSNISSNQTDVFDIADSDDRDFQIRIEIRDANKSNNEFSEDTCEVSNSSNVPDNLEIIDENPDNNETFNDFHEKPDEIQANDATTNLNQLSDVSNTLLNNSCDISAPDDADNTQSSNNESNNNETVGLISSIEINEPLKNRRKKTNKNTKEKQIILPNNQGVNTEEKSENEKSTEVLTFDSVRINKVKTYERKKNKTTNKNTTSPRKKTLRNCSVRLIDINKSGASPETKTKTNEDCRRVKTKTKNTTTEDGNIDCKTPKSPSITCNEDVFSKNLNVDLSKLIFDAGKKASGGLKRKTNEYKNSKRAKITMAANRCGESPERIEKNAAAARKIELPLDDEKILYRCGKYVKKCRPDELKKKHIVGYECYICNKMFDTYDVCDKHIESKHIRSKHTKK